MLFCGRKLTAQEACSRGLVSQVFWPTTFSQEVMLRVKEMASCSAVVRNQTPLWLNYISQRQGVLPRLITSERWVLSFHNHTCGRGLTTENINRDQWAHGVSHFSGAWRVVYFPHLHIYSVWVEPPCLRFWKGILAPVSFTKVEESETIQLYQEISVGPVRKYICLSRCPGLLRFSWVCLLFCTCIVPDSAKCSTQCTRRVG